MRIVVTGCKEYDDERMLNHCLDVFHRKHAITKLCHSGNKGADTLAGTWAASHGIPVTIIRADWGLYGKRAGLIRDRMMIDDWKPDAVIAFTGEGAGNTAFCVARALDQSIPTWIIEPTLLSRSD